MPEGYMPRLVENRLDALMESFGCAEINGPKWCVKTQMARNGVGAASRIGHERELSGNVQNFGKERARRLRFALWRRSLRRSNDVPDRVRRESAFVSSSFV